MYDHEIDVVAIDPTDDGYDELGHLKFFSRSRRLAWESVAEWFDAR